jgi:short-subunit dehydrogenase
VVAISSLAAEVPMLDTHAYAASKAAIASWFGCLRIELRRDAALAGRVAACLVVFSAVKTATLVAALGGEGGPNKKVLALAARPVDAAFATVEAAVARAPVTHFPRSVGVLPRLYALWPWLARKLIDSVTVKSGAP